MARPLNMVLKNRVLNFLKQEWLKEGCCIISPSYVTIAKAIQQEGQKLETSEAIKRTIDLLAKRGEIIVHHNKGSNANQYEFVNETVQDYIKEVSQQNNEQLSNYIQGFNDNLQNIVSLCGATIKENQKLLGENAFMKELLADLEVVETGADRIELFKSKKRSASIIQFIEQVKHEMENNKK